MTRGRKLTEHERALWRGITRSVAPLKRRRMPAEPDAGVAPEKDGRAAAARAHAPPVRLSPAPKRSPPLPALMPLDRRTRQRIARGTETIDARLDLHGRTQNEAHDALLRF